MKPNLKKSLFTCPLLVTIDLIRLIKNVLWTNIFIKNYVSNEQSTNKLPGLKVGGISV